MDKILEKLGIYDLVVLLLTGMIILLLSLKISPLFNIDLEINDTLQFLIISYFVGMIFQEIGSKISNKKMLKNVFEKSDDYHISLLEEEKIFITSKISEILNVDSSDLNINVIYNHCKNKYLHHNNTYNEIDKQQSIGGMARSLFIYFMCIFFTFTIKLVFCHDIKYLYLMFISLLLSYIFYNRYIRFYKMRYVYILRWFYYKNRI